MPTYIALLRGINVGGHKKILMADLRALLSTLDFEDIQTYIQSGNVIFKSPIRAIGKLEDMIQKAILEAYKFEVPVIVKKPKDLAYALTHSPFEKEAIKEPSKHYITFLKRRPSDENAALLKSNDLSPEIVALDGDILYFFPALGMARTKLSNPFFEKKLKVEMTGRNWRTVQKLLDLTTL